MGGLAYVYMFIAFLVVLRLWWSNHGEYLWSGLTRWLLLTLLSSLEIMTFVLVPVWRAWRTWTKTRASSITSLQQLLDLWRPGLIIQGGGSLQWQAQLSSLPRQVNLHSSYWWYPMAFLTKLIVFSLSLILPTVDIAVWLTAHLTLWTDSSSPENILITVTRLSWRLVHLETDLQLGGEPPAVCVWTREEARDAEDDIVAVRIVRDAVTIRDHCPIACNK